MDHTHKVLLRSSLRQLQPLRSEAAGIFISRLFEIAPYVRPLFRGDVMAHGTKFMEMVEQTILALDEEEPLRQRMRSMGRTHALVGVARAHYDIIASALLWTLERVLGEHCTEEVRAAWIELYVLVSTEMKQGAADLYRAA